MYLLSVIIPVYNASAWLAQCVASLLDPTGHCPDALQLILVDDGSSDDSLAICRAYAARSAHIRLLCQPHLGVAAARNTGLAAAEGEYIAWVDPDDYVSPQWFAVLRDTITRHSPDLIVMDMLRFGPEGDREERYGREAGFVDRALFCADVIRDIRMRSGLPNKVIRACHYQSIRFDPDCPILEDFAAMPAILRNVRTVYYIPQCLYHYRQHHSSLLHHVTPERAFLSVEIALKRLEAVDASFRPAATTAVCCQMLRYCGNRHQTPAYDPMEDQLRFCRRYIRRHLPTLMADPELPMGLKGRLLSIAFGVYDLLAVCKNRIRQRIR